ncbi:SMI1/KNR4 family protein [Prosthecobacter sp.]|uniref:SMI1/KNR4 family protein n=1 Tax=Prosthecobacter sp. TaxID=1965333 RepID=UPI00248A7841|nr:SMI1/KNR4 family protein [Prosthecobacter sp.]MDI1310858.1 SMI1/KNR4 family protein [Prosthecobacter sp.]
MMLEWKYCFEAGTQSRGFLQELIEQRDRGLFLGSSFPDGYCHSCFTKQQCDMVDQLAAGIQGLNFERTFVFRGNLFARDFGMNLFAEPFVQWCPSPIYSMRFSQLVPPIEPWGKSMDGKLIFGSDLESLIRNSVVGLAPVNHQLMPNLLLYRPTLEIDVNHECHESTPLSLDCSLMPEADFVKLQSGVLLCSSRFARVLSRSWDGSINAKFQPVKCLGASKSLRSRNLAKMKMPTAFDSKELEDSFISMENLLKISFPDDYKFWALKNQGKLPQGWLSPIGGDKADIVRHTKQERVEADPPMPGNLVPLFAFGDGDYICVDSNCTHYVKWTHEDGKYEMIGESYIKEIMNPRANQ